MKASYRLFVKAVLMLPVMLSTTSGAWAVLQLESSRGQCSALINGFDSTLSLVLLELVDLGLLEFQKDLPKFISNLRAANESSAPMNPFLNLHSPLARAVSQKAEHILESPGFDWAWIRSQLPQRIARHASKVAAKVNDQEMTKEVRGMAFLPFDTLLPKGTRDVVLSASDFRYIGETRNFHVIAAGAFFGGHNSADLKHPWVAYLISKVDHRIQQLDIRLVGTFFGQMMLWVDNDNLYGVTADQLPFKLEPDSYKVTLAKVPVNLANFTFNNIAWWDYSERTYVDVAEAETFKSFALPQNGTIVNITKTATPRTFDISKLDWSTLEFQTVHTIQLPESSFKRNKSWPAHVGPKIDDDHFTSAWVAVGTGPSVSAMVSADGYFDGSADPQTGDRTFVWRDTKLEYDRVKDSESLTVSAFHPTLPMAARSDTIFFQSESMIHLYSASRRILANSPLGLLYLRRGEAPSPSYQGASYLYGYRAFDRLMGMWLFDRELFKLIPVSIQDLPDALGWWRSIETPKGDLLFEFRERHSTFVEVWILDVEARILKKVLTAKPPIEHREVTTGPVIDYNKMELVGWVLKDGLLLPTISTLTRSAE